MRHQRLPDGRIRVPMRVDQDGLIGDGMVTLAPGDVGYAEALADLHEQEQVDRLLSTPSERFFMDSLDGVTITYPETPPD